MWKKKGRFDNEIRFEVPVPDFIPYACHYDPATILTKNGELLQTIKIVGFSYEIIGAKQMDLREIVRNAITESINSDRFAIWIHTVRKKKNLDPGGEYKNIFAQTTHDSWCTKNYWRDKYVNELYITIIHEGSSFSIKGLKDFLQSFSYPMVKAQNERSLKNAYKNLNAVVENILDKLKEFGAKKLTMVEDYKGAYSEPLQFFDKIIHLSEQRLPVPLVDLSKQLANNQIAFGNYAFEVKGKRKKFYGSILTIKECHEVSSKAIDKFLQLPQEFVITQILQFTDSKEALKDFKYQEYILNISGDANLKKMSGIEDIIKSETGKKTDYCFNQLSIMLFADNLYKLDDEVKRANKELFKLGIVTVLEDLNLENCFWSQLPANFSFICRNSLIYTRALGGFASLHNFPAGKLTSVWGEAVTLFRTALGTPYFFNFHENNSGHTLIVGPEGSGKSTLANFLISESYKYAPKIFIIDQNNESKLLVKALGGKYKILNSNEPQNIRFNPLLLKDDQENRKFICEWLKCILFSYNDLSSLNSRYDDLIYNLVDKIYLQPIEKRQLKYLPEIINDINALKDETGLKDNLANWIGEGKYGYVFDHDSDELEDEHQVLSYDLSMISHLNEVLVPVVFYLFHKFKIQLDDFPAIFGINNAWSLLNNPLLQNNLTSLLDALTNKNALVLATIELNEEIIDNQFINELMQKMVTKIFLPNSEVSIYEKAFRLSNKELELIKSMRIINHNFLLKQGDDAIVAELNLAGLNHILAIISSDAKASSMISDITLEVGDNPDNWLPIFYDQYNANNGKK